MTERQPLAPVEGLRRESRLPGPPARPAPVTRLAPPPPLPKVSPVVTDAAPAPRAPRRASDTAETRRNVALSLPVSVVEDLRRRARADRASQPEVLLDALAATQDRLAELVKSTEPSRRWVDDGLFVRSAPRVSEALTTLSLRMMSSNVDAIDQLVASSEAPSRSMLCAVALRAYLNDPTP